MKASKITFAAVIAALYAGLTFMLAPISFGFIQFRLSEALCLLPFLYPESVPGLFIGCLIANGLGAALGISTVWDIIFGSVATLIAAILTSKIKNKWLAALPPVVTNAIIVGPMLAILFTEQASWGVQIPLYTFSVAIGEATVLYAAGIPLIYTIQKLKPRIDAIFYGKRNI